MTLSGKARLATTENIFVEKELRMMRYEIMNTQSKIQNPKSKTSLSESLVVFTLDDNRFALPLSPVERVVRMVEITPLPKAPEIVMGVINVEGRIIPVVNIRRRFRLPEGNCNLYNQIILAKTPRRTLGIMVDTVTGVAQYTDKDIVPADKILPDIEYVKGVAKFKDGMALIHDIDTFLSLEEEKILDNAMKEV
ncbi:MAG: chemotaxis protein CheW [Candidatus Brocadiaceae bacterium]